MSVFETLNPPHNSFFFISDAQELLPLSNKPNVSVEKITDKKEKNLISFKNSYAALHNPIIKKNQKKKKEKKSTST